MSPAPCSSTVWKASKKEASGGQDLLILSLYFFEQQPKQHSLLILANGMANKTEIFLQLKERSCFH